ncbi:MAG: DUF1080 domain-containing protein [Tannerella sp.]|jgi:hypothetical protein|nr:DUF1080 domain-containing protein [Tannerella sp.]
MKTIFNLLTGAFMCLCVSCNTSNDGWIPLFNGKDLTGFRQLNGRAPFRVENGEIVGVSTKNEPSSFLATEQDYGDFILEFDVLCAPALNSGVQFRSLSRPDFRDGCVHGYQCEIDPSDRAWSGGIYDEARRGWLVTLADNPDGRAAYRKTGWNHYRVEALGDCLRIWLNGVNTANLRDNTTPRGFIALQIHSIGNRDAQDGMEIRWKNLRILTENLEANRMQGTLAPEVNRIPNTLSEQERADGWELLFDGKTSTGWRGACRDAFPERGWKIEDGQLTVLKAEGDERGGDIVTEGRYGTFELSLEFKLTKGANSGIKYFTVESGKPHCSAFGPEYQLLDDDGHSDAGQATSFPGSRTLAGLYDLMAPERKRTNPIGEWNLAQIKVSADSRVEHWLNGFETLAYKRGSEAFRERVKGSKFADPSYHASGPFGEASEGLILLQDHGDEVAFRSIKIKNLKRK